MFGLTRCHIKCPEKATNPLAPENNSNSREIARTTRLLGQAIARIERADLPWTIHDPSISDILHEFHLPLQRAKYQCIAFMT